MEDKIKLTIHAVGIGERLPIPLAGQSVKAGFPSPAQDYMEGEIDLNEVLIRHREATFYVRISGDSMTGAGILDGDLAIVDRQIEPSNGNFVIAFVDGEYHQAIQDRRKRNLRLAHSLEQGLHSHPCRRNQPLHDMGCRHLCHSSHSRIRKNRNQQTQ